MSKVDDYRAYLRSHEDWVEYLQQESGLPGPRGNLELAAAVAEEGNASFFQECIGYDRPELSGNTPSDYLIFCGVAGYGKLLSKGDLTALPILRHYASDGRWRLREGVAIGLQYLGAQDMPALIAEMVEWSKGNPYEQRAAAAALCEPKLLVREDEVVRVLQILDAITAAIPQISDRRRDDFVALRKGLGYCWSVAVAAAPNVGKAMMEHWLKSSDPDIHWIMRENLTKNRLTRMDAAWVAAAQQQLAAG
jgi:hypothetical protein